MCVAWGLGFGYMAATTNNSHRSAAVSHKSLRRILPVVL